MADTLKLQVAKCPNCGFTLTQFSPFKKEMKCPHCKAAIVNPQAITKEGEMPERIIPFTTDDKAFERNITESLVAQDFVPRDIFQLISMGEAGRAYIPMYLYEGTFASSWSCKVAVMENEVRANFSGDKVKNEKVKKFKPTSGTSQGNFAFLCIAYQGQALPEELLDFTATFPYSPEFSKPFDPDLLVGTEGDEVKTVEVNVDRETLWSKNGQGLVDELAKSKAIEQLSGEEVQNFRVSSSYNLTTRGRLVMVPFWFIYYQYKESKNYFLMDGLGNRSAYSYPSDEEEVSFVEGLEKKIKMWKWLRWLPMLLILIGQFSFAIGLTVCAFIAGYIRKKQINGKIEQRLGESRQIRAAAAAAL